MRTVDESMHMLRSFGYNEGQLAYMTRGQSAEQLSRWVDIELEERAPYLVSGRKYPNEA